MFFFLSLGDEMGMLEDVCVSISNLTCVKFKVTCNFVLVVVSVQGFFKRKLVRNILSNQDAKTPLKFYILSKEGMYKGHTYMAYKSFERIDKN